MQRGPDGAGSGCAMVAPLPMEHPRRNRQRRRLRYANPIHAASKSDTPRVSGDQSGAREGQTTAGADTKERLNTCNRQLLTRALPTVPNPASTVGDARALSTPGDSRPPSSTKRYAVAAVERAKRPSLVTARLTYQRPKIGGSISSCSNTGCVNVQRSVRGPSSESRWSTYLYITARCISASHGGSLLGALDCRFEQRKRVLLKQRRSRISVWGLTYAIRRCRSRPARGPSRTRSRSRS